MFRPEHVPLNQTHYYVQLFLKGRDQALLYEVTKEESDRVATYFLNVQEDSLIKAFAFDTTEERIIAVNPRYILLCQVLFEAGTPESRKRPDDEEDIDLAIEIHGLKEPLEYRDLDPLHIAFAVEDMQLPGTEFIDFIDEDGEYNFVRTEAVMLLDCMNFQPRFDEWSKEEYGDEPEEPATKEAKKRPRPPRAGPGRGSPKRLSN